VRWDHPKNTLGQQSSVGSQSLCKWHTVKPARQVLGEHIVLLMAPDGMQHSVPPQSSGPSQVTMKSPAQAAGAVHSWKGAVSLTQQTCSRLQIPQPHKMPSNGTVPPSPPVSPPPAPPASPALPARPAFPATPAVAPDGLPPLPASPADPPATSPPLPPVTTPPAAPVPAPLVPPLGSPLEPPSGAAPVPPLRAPPAPPDWLPAEPPVSVAQSGSSAHAVWQTPSASHDTPTEPLLVSPPQATQAYAANVARTRTTGPLVTSSPALASLPREGPRVSLRRRRNGRERQRPSLVVPSRSACIRCRCPGKRELARWLGMVRSRRPRTRCTVATATNLWPRRGPTRPGRPAALPGKGTSRGS
jgi:hypothetical protein